MRASVLLLMSAAACASGVQSAMFIPGNVPSNAPVRIYGETRPACAFEEIGWVSGERRTRRDTPDDVLNAMRVRAREMGGDAIIGLSSTNRTDGAMMTGANEPIVVAAVTNTNVFHGTVVRFTDPQCAPE